MARQIYYGWHLMTPRLVAIAIIRLVDARSDQGRGPVG